MTHIILSEMVASISELKRHPMTTVNNAKGKPLAILSHNEPVFYCISAKTYETMMDALEDAHWAKVVRARAGEKRIEVNINDL